MDASDAATVWIFTIVSFVLALGMVLLALGPLRERGEGRVRGAQDAEDGLDDVPAPFAPDRHSPLGATDQTADEESARGTRSAAPGETRS